MNEQNKIKDLVQEITGLFFMLVKSFFLKRGKKAFWKEIHSHSSIKFFSLTFRKFWLIFLTDKECQTHNSQMMNREILYNVLSESNQKSEELGFLFGINSFHFSFKTF